MSNNVIQFPKTKINATTAAEELDSLIFTRVEKAQTIADEILEVAVNIMRNYGYFNGSNEKVHMKDFIFIAEALAATMLRYNDIDSNLHQIIDTYVKIEGEDYYLDENGEMVPIGKDVDI